MFLKYFFSSATEDELQLFGTAKISRNDHISPILYGFGPGDVIREGSLFTYAYVPSLKYKDYELVNDIRIKLSPFTTTSSRKNKILKWKSQKYSFTTNDIQLNNEGVYIIAANFITVPAGTEVSFTMRSKDRILFKSTYSSTSNRLFTFLLAGVVVFKTSKTISLHVHVNTEQMVTVKAKSSVSITYLAKSTNQHPLITLRVTDKTYHHWMKDEWTLINVFKVDTNTKFFFENNKIVPVVDGVYFLSVHVIVSSVDS